MPVNLLSLEKCLFRSFANFFLLDCGVFWYEMFVYFGDESLVGSFVCKDFLPFCGFLIYLFIFLIFPLYSKGVRLSLHVYYILFYLNHTIFFFAFFF